MASRIVVGGVSASAMLGLVATLASAANTGDDVSVAATGTGPAKVVVVRKVHRQVIVPTTAGGDPGAVDPTLPADAAAASVIAADGTITPTPATRKTQGVGGTGTTATTASGGAATTEPNTQTVAASPGSPAPVTATPSTRPSTPAPAPAPTVTAPPATSPPATNPPETTTTEPPPDPPQCSGTMC